MNQILNINDGIDPLVRTLKVSNQIFKEFNLAWNNLDHDKYWLWRWGRHPCIIRSLILACFSCKQNFARNWSSNDWSSHMAPRKHSRWEYEVKKYGSLGNIHYWCFDKVYRRGLISKSSVEIGITKQHYLVCQQFI